MERERHREREDERHSEKSVSFLLRLSSKSSLILNLLCLCTCPCGFHLSGLLSFSLSSLTVPRCNLLRPLEENGPVIICMFVDREDTKNFCEIGVTVKRVCMR